MSRGARAQVPDVHPLQHRLPGAAASSRSKNADQSGCGFCRPGISCHHQEREGTGCGVLKRLLHCNTGSTASGAAQGKAGPAASDMWSFYTDQIGRCDADVRTVRAIVQAWELVLLSSSPI